MKVNKNFLVYVLIFTIFFFILLQIIFISLKIGNVSEELIYKGMDASKKASIQASSENKFRIFPLVVNMDLTNTVYNLSHEIKTDIIDFVDKKPASSLYICDLGVKSVSTQFSKVGILILDKNTGSSLLHNDILNNDVEYIVLQSKIFKINYDSLVNDRIKNLLDNKKIMYNTDFISFLIFSPMNHTVVDSTDITSDCQYRVIPFIGSMVKISGSDYFIDLNVELFSSTVTNSLPIHMIAYKTM